MPSNPSAQTAKNVKETMLCIDCDKPRVLYAAKKLSKSELTVLLKIMERYQYSCGCCLQDLKTGDGTTPRVDNLLTKVFLRSNLTCTVPMEVPYFSSDAFEDVFFFCAQKLNLMRGDGCYPLCNQCHGLKKSQAKLTCRKTEQNKSKENCLT